MVNIEKLPSLVLEKILVQVVAGAREKYSEMDKLTKVSTKWSDVIHGAVKPMKRALTMVGDLFWDMDELSEEVDLMKKYEQFKTVQHLCLQPYEFAQAFYWDYPLYQPYVRFLEQSSEYTIQLDVTMGRFHAHRDEIEAVLQDLNPTETVFWVYDLNLFSHLNLLTALDLTKIQITIDWQLLSSLLREDALYEYQLTLVLTPTIELLNPSEYPVVDNCTAIVTGSGYKTAYSFPMSDDRIEKIFEFLITNFKAEAEKQKQEATDDDDDSSENDNSSSDENSDDNYY